MKYVIGDTNRIYCDVCLGEKLKGKVTISDFHTREN